MIFLNVSQVASSSRTTAEEHLTGLLAAEDDGGVYRRTRTHRGCLSLSPTNRSEPSGPLREVTLSPLVALLRLTLSLSSPSAISGRLSFSVFLSLSVFFFFFLILLSSSLPADCSARVQWASALHLVHPPLPPRH